MPSFAQFLNLSGVFASQSFMIVPRGGFNLVCLRDSKGVHLSYDHNRLQVDDVGLEQVEGVAKEYIQTRYGKDKSQERDDQLLRLRTALYGTARPGGLARGLKVTARDVKGIPELKATLGNISIKLDVAIMPRKDYTISFKFLRQLDQSGKLIDATKWKLQDVPWFLRRLNWTFGAQTNIFFSSVDDAWFPVQRAMGPKISRDDFRKYIVPKKARADLTCFLVGDYDALDSEAAGQYLVDEEVCVVVDAGNPPVFAHGEAFIGVMAHEVGHFLHHKRNMPGSGHHDRKGILLSSGMESLALDRQLVSDLNAW